MGLSTSLLLLAVLAALVPVTAIGPRPPETIRELEKGFVFGAATLVIGGVVLSLFHSLNVFGLIHAIYLLVVVSIPLLFGSWWVLGRLRGRERRWTKVGGVAAVLIALIGVWSTHIEPNWLAVDQVTLGAAVDEPLTIGVMADLQTPNVGKHEQSAIDELLAAEPNLVLVPGDLFQGNPGVVEAATPDFIALLQQLTEQVAVVAVVSGDSDRPGQLRPIVEAAGALFIDNQITDVEIAGQPVRLAGISVFAANSRLDTLAALVQPSDAFTILLAHRPGAVYDLPAGSDVDLIVAGHTHGGQVSLPFLGPPVTLSEVPRDIAAGGLGVVDNYPIYVSVGVGLERNQAPQVRFGVRPEVGIIEIVPAG